jgi:hypothetical protein
LLRFHALPSSCGVSVSRVVCVARMDVGVVLLSCCYVPHSYACLHAVALVECVSLIIMDVKLKISLEERKTFSRKIHIEYTRSSRMLFTVRCSSQILNMGSRPDLDSRILRRYFDL